MAAVCYQKRQSKTEAHRAMVITRQLTKSKIVIALFFIIY